MQSLILQEDWDCRKCTASQKITRGCTSAPKHKVEFDGVVLERCPRRPMLDDPEGWSDVFFMFRNYERGILPEEGALLSQPNRLLELFTVIEENRTLAERAKEAKERKRRAAAA